jgi:hypothetical protein
MGKAVRGFMKRFYNKKIVIAPYSRMSLALKEYMEKNLNIDFINFLDKNKEQYNIKNLKNEFDYIVILSPNYGFEIYQELKKRFPSKKIVILNKNSANGYKIYTKLDIFLEKLNLRENFFLTYIKILKIFPKTKRAVFIAEVGVDSNLFHTFVEFYKNNYNSLILSDDSFVKNRFKQFNLPIKPLDSLISWFYIITSKNIILTHESAKYIKYCDIKKQKVTQLWHGVGLKKMTTRNKEFEYNYFISTSNWTNETNFKHIFKAKKFLNLGYSRNDILLKEKLDKHDTLLCDKKLLKKAQKN